jgi:hypothetical protein
MKLFAVILTLTAAVLASPTEVKRQACKPATYACTSNNAGWQVCNTSGVFVVSPHSYPGPPSELLVLNCIPGWRIVPTRYRLCVRLEERISILCATRLQDPWLVK